MDHYLDIRLLPDPEFATTLLMNAAYNKLHRGLVQLQCTDIGVSFPGYDAKKRTLGDSIRLHGSVERLSALMETGWLKGMTDHVQVGRILLVPEHCQPIKVRRVQAKSNVERLRRRQMRRHNLTREEVVARIPDSVEERLALPFLILKSKSTEQQFRLFVRQERGLTVESGVFNAYGLSGTATLPSF